MRDEEVSRPPLTVRNKSAGFSLWEEASVIGLVKDGIAKGIMTTHSLILHSDTTVWLPNESIGWLQARHEGLLVG